MAPFTWTIRIRLLPERRRPRHPATSKMYALDARAVLIGVEWRYCEVAGLGARSRRRDKRESVSRRAEQWFPAAIGPEG